MKFLLRYAPIIAASFLLISAAGASVLLRPAYGAPNTIPNLVMWLKADAVAGSDGDTVTTWSDQSGHGNNMTTRGTGPTLSTNALNGKPVLSFTTSESLVNLGITFPSTWTILYVGRLTGGTNQRMLQSGSGGSNWLLGAWGGRENVAHFENWLTGLTSDVNIDADTQWRLFIGEADGTAANVYMNGEHILTSTSYRYPPTGLGLNDGQYYGEVSDMQIAEVVAYDGTLTQAQRAGLEVYFKNKYGIDIAPEFVTSSVTVNPGTTYTVPLTDELLGYWSMDAETIHGSTVDDQSHGGHNGTVFGVSSLPTDAGVKNEAGSFDGGTIIHTALPLPTTMFTKSAWIKLSSCTTGDANNIISSADDTATAFWAPYIAGSCKLAAGTSGSWEQVEDGASLDVGTWYFVALTYDSFAAGGLLKLYKNGALVDTAANVSPPGIASDVYIGGHYAGNYFKGDIDDARVYGRVLTEDEIAALYHGQDSVPVTQTGAYSEALIGHWTFDSGDVGGGVANDVSDIGNNFSIQGSVPMVSGVFGDAASFDGSGSGYLLASPFIGNPTTYMTLCAWVKTPGSGGNQFIFNIQRNGGDNNNEGVFEILSTGALRFWDYGTSMTGFGFADAGGSAQRVDDNEWHLACFVKNNLSGTYYVDGRGSAAPTASHDVHYGGTYWAMGKDYRDNISYFNGLIDEPRVYSRALSPEEMHDLYMQGRSQKTTVNDSRNSRNTSGLVGLWSFDGPDISWADQYVYDRAYFGTGTMHGLSQHGSVVPGKIGQALVFDGTNYITGSDGFLPSGNHARTINVWVKPASLPASSGDANIVFGYGTAATDEGFGLGLVNSSGTQVIDMFGWNDDFYGTYTLPTNKWTMLTAVYDGSSAQIYVNASNDLPEGGSPSGWGTVLSGYIIGRSLDGSNAYHGAVDDLRVYNRALAPSEIQALYLMGN